MNSSDNHKLEASVQRELGLLGELAAPPALSGRMLRAIERRAAVPWHRRAWQTWPPAMQVASAAALILLFAGICLGAVELLQAAKVTPAGRHAGEWIAGIRVLWQAAGALAGAVATAILQLGPGILLGCGLALGAACAACFGLGGACVRLALARR